jgi:signal peptidase I
MKKDESITRSVVKYGITLAVLLLILMAIVNILPFINKYKTFIIQTDSMQPVINVDDVAVIDTEFIESDIRPGVIIAFYQNIMGDSTDEVVVHRVDDVFYDEEDNLQVKTMGDYIEVQDEWTLDTKDIIGVYNTNIPGVGRYVMFLQSWIGRIVLIADILIIYALFKVLTKKDNEKHIDSKIENEVENIEVIDNQKSPSIKQQVE